MRIGLISDTHGLLRPEAEQFLAGCDHIVHAGDIGRADILQRLEAIAPVSAVRGNNDHGPWAEAVPETQALTLGGVCVFVLHDVKELASHEPPAGVQVIVCGHSHHPVIDQRPGVLVVNPGSAGPRRFSLPVSAGELRIGADGRFEASLRRLL